jgi:hypothetical protein
MMFPCLFARGGEKNCQQVGGAILANYRRSWHHHYLYENESKHALKIMTQNVDAGTDFGYLTGVSGPAAFAQGVFFTYLEINASNIVPRAAQLAGEIALDHPAMNWSILPEREDAI